MIKRVLTLSLALIMVLSLVGCNSSSGASTPNAPAESVADDLPEVTWRFSINTASTMPASIAAEAMAAKVSERTNGKFKLEVYLDNVLGAYEAVFEEVMRGSIEMSANALPTTYDSRIEMLQIPYLVTSFDEARVVFAPGSRVYDKLCEILEDGNIKNLGLFGDGFVGVGVMDLDPNYADPAAPKKQLLRTSASTSNRIIVESMGYKTVTISFSELFTSMQTGVCDGWFGGSVMSNYNNFRDIIKYYINYRAILDKKAFIVNMDAWNALPPEYQIVLEEEVAAICNGSYDNLAKLDKEYQAKLAEAGVEFVDFTDEEIAIIAEHVRKDTWGVMEELCTKEIMDLARQDVEKLKK